MKITGKDEHYGADRIKEELHGKIEECISEGSMCCRYWLPVSYEYLAFRALDELTELYEESGWDVDVSNWSDFGYPGIKGYARVFKISLS